MLIEQLDLVNNEISNFKDRYYTFLQNKSEELKKLIEIASNLDESWSQSWIGFHSNLYFEDFQTPPPLLEFKFNSEWGSINGIPRYWIEKKYDDIVNYVERKSNGVTLLAIENQIKPITEVVKDLHQEVLATLSLFEDDGRFSNEFELIKEIKNYRWRTSISDLIAVKRPKNYYTRDSFALSQGIRTPPHIIYECSAISLRSEINSILEFIAALN